MHTLLPFPASAIIGRLSSSRCFDMLTARELFPLISAWLAGIYSESRVALVTGRRVSASPSPTFSYNFLDWPEMWFARLFCYLSTPDCYLIMSLGSSGTITCVWWLKAPSFPGIIAFSLWCAACQSSLNSWFSSARSCPPLLQALLLHLDSVITMMTPNNKSKTEALTCARQYT